MEQIDGVRYPLAVNHHQRFGVQRNKITLRDDDLPSIGQMKREGTEPILQPVLDLFEHWNC